MKYLIPVLILVSVFFQSKAQDLPLKIEVPALSKDPNLQFSMLDFDVIDKDKFSILYFNMIYGSVLHSGEFVSDTGQIVYSDPKKEKVILHSSEVILLKKQIVDGSGKLFSEQEWLLAARTLESGGEYKLYFPKDFKHTMVANRSIIDKSIYNLDAVIGLSSNEMAALVELTRPMIPQAQTPSEPYYAETSTLAEDIMATKKQFKSLRATGLLFKGNLPSNESVLTRYSIVSDRNFVITKSKDKSKSNLLKFYLTEDYKTFDCLDSARIEGDVTLTSAATVYNTNGEAIGAFANLHVKSKDEKGEDIGQQFSVAMDANYTIGTWMYSVGKNKLNSLSPEVCWYEGSKLWVMSNNREKFFKSYIQMHVLEKGQAAQTLYPTSEEEKGSEKSKYAKSYQPDPPSGIGTAEPIPERYIPIYFTNAGLTRYIIMEGTRMDETSKSRQYLSVNIYRIDSAGKVTNIDMMTNYKGFVPMPLPRIIKNPNNEFFLLQYPVKVQLAFYKDRSEINPLDIDNSALIAKPNRQFLSSNNKGTVLLRRTNMGIKYTLLFYPKQ